jgi:DNA mismatch endonuclease (patch repair protein)
LKKKAKKPAKKSLSKKRISYTMSRVRSSGSEIETILGKALWCAGVRYRKQYPIFGKPDFVIVQRRIAIFCDSEFWHGYRWGIRRRLEHKTNQSYWFQKIERNRARDREVNSRLGKEGWTVIRLWERQIYRDSADCALKIRELARKQ